VFVTTFWKCASYVHVPLLSLEDNDANLQEIVAIRERSRIT